MLFGILSKSNGELTCNHLETGGRCTRDTSCVDSHLMLDLGSRDYTYRYGVRLSDIFRRPQAGSAKVKTLNYEPDYLFANKHCATKECIEWDSVNLPAASSTQTQLQSQICHGQLPSPKFIQ
jgi:hypothetical protein